MCCLLPVFHVLHILSVLHVLHLTFVPCSASYLCPMCCILPVLHVLHLACVCKCSIFCLCYMYCIFLCSMCCILPVLHVLHLVFACATGLAYFPKLFCKKWYPKMFSSLKLLPSVPHPTCSNGRGCCRRLWWVHECEDQRILLCCTGRYCFGYKVRKTIGKTGIKKEGSRQGYWSVTCFSAVQVRVNQNTFGYQKARN